METKGVREEERERETSTEGINENNKREMRAGLKERAAKLMKS